jgi:hypothetical protein
VTAALLVLLGLSAPLRAPDLQVEAVTTAGVALPELADAVARALVVSGTRVVLRGPSSEPCPYCAKVAVIEAGQGNCRVEVKQERHTASAALHFPAGSPLFDRARAIAIQARLLVTWETSPDARAKETAARLATRKSERKVLLEQPISEPQVASDDLAPIKESELVPGPQPEPVALRIPDPHPPVVPERRVDSPLVGPVTYVERAGAKPVDGVETPKAEAARASPRRGPPVEVASVSLEPRKKQWPWIPTVVGAGAAVAAGICAVVARDRYNGLSDKSQPYQTARALRSEGQNWQVASIVLAGVAVAGVTTGLIGFVTRSSERSSTGLVATPVPGGGMIALEGDLP